MAFLASALLAFVIPASNAEGATLGLSSGNASPGTRVVLNLSLSGASTLPAAIQWTLSYSATDFSSVAVSAGAQATAASKSISCNSTAGSTTCVAWGMNASPISNGVIAGVSLAVSPSTTNASSQIGVSGTLGADPAGMAVAVSADGASVTIAQPPGLDGFSCSPLTLTPSVQSVCTVSLTTAAPSGGSIIALTGPAAAVTLTGSITIPQAGRSGTFTVSAKSVAATTEATLTASYRGVTEGIGVTVDPASGSSSLPVCAGADTSGVPLFWQNNAGYQSTVWGNTGPESNPYRAGSGWAYISGAGDPDWKLVGSGDFNGDGAPDVVWQNEGTRQVSICFVGTSLPAGYLAPPEPGWHIAAVGDFNLDGHPDLVWMNDATGEATVWYMDGATMLSWAYLSSVSNPGWNIVGVGDFNRDGHPDLIWQNASTRQITVWYMNNNAMQSWAWVSSAGTPGETVVGAGDVNGDGWPDIVFQNDSTTAVTVWYMIGTNTSSTATIVSGEPGWTAIRR